MEIQARLITDDGTEHPLIETLTVGRSDDCDITLPSSKVSRQHARFRLAEDGVTVEDLGSSNGTRLNGRAIGSAQALMDGDQVGIDTFTLTVAIISDDAREASDDATVIAAPADDDATMLAPAAEAPQAAARPASPPGPSASGAAAASDVAAPTGDLPGSWVDSGTGESTQFLSPDALAAQRPQAASAERHSPLAHFIVIAADGSASDVFELETGGGEEDTWELGRDDSCDIPLNDPTVSARHAQLVHKGGRWRMVNLVSSNGIVVNGEKRLSVYLDGGDSVQLGEVRLVFNAPEGGATGPSSGGKAATPAAASGSRLPLMIGIVVVVAVLAIAAVALL
ncbi:FHA domain-containing protein [Chromatocurvus halotolerans]|uniref:Type III secretion system (T3SS) inner membrane Yop/YscD-like protein n=1 Tax=Chromatocurvus halotolerans TaxID=1132028 RepID=A0A4R2KM32_9GAMM|nr:FHA domain-containing protein [Chromatocurvus halotolerans]TCO71756.1 type III secretion system (T3SS) inner membrane Yop/YscD-like protein [Chromatocurvus halotolerans]